MSRRLRDAPGQSTIDWDRGSQLQALNRIELPTPLIGLGYRVSHSSAKHVLRVIDDHQRENDDCFPSLETIAKCAGLRSVKTVSRAIDALEQLSIIRVTPGTTPRGYPVLILSIDWQVVFGRMPEEKPVRQRRRGGRRQCPEDIYSKPEDIGSEPEDTNSTALYMNRTMNRPPEPSTRHTHARREFLAPSDHDEWWRVEGELCELGVRAASRAVASCRDRISVEYALQLCRHFREHHAREKWDAIVLYQRVRSASEDASPASGWPKSSRPASVETHVEEDSAGRELDSWTEATIAEFARQHGLGSHLEMCRSPRHFANVPEMRSRLLRLIATQEVLS